MDNKDFDRLLREKFAAEPLKERTDGWKQLSERLSGAKKQRPLFPVLRVAAALLILLGLASGVLLLWNRQHSEEKPATWTDNQRMERQIKENATNPDNQQNNDVKIVRQQNSLPEATQENEAKNSQPSLSEQEPNNNNQQWVKKDNRKSDKNRIPVTPGNTVMPVADSMSMAGKYVAHETKKKQPANDEAAVKNEVTVDRAENSGLSRRLVESEMEKDYGNNVYPESMPASSGHRAAISLGGGMNYGSLNTGYALGVSARHSIGKHFFVEGSVAFMYNNQAPNTSNYPGPPTTPSRPASYSPNNPQSPSMRLVSNFYYVQVNPSFGYQINKLLAISAGIDLQQRIASMSQNGTAVFTPSTDPRIIPQLDFGITGKTEFFISPKVEAGVLYRNGLNNLVQAKDVHPFLNRRYIQVQLKYNFLLGK